MVESNNKNFRKCHRYDILVELENLVDQKNSATTREGLFQKLGTSLPYSI